MDNEIDNRVMLSGEGNENGQKATLHVQHTFVYISLPLLCTTTL